MFGVVEVTMRDVDVVSPRGAGDPAGLQGVGTAELERSRHVPRGARFFSDLRVSLMHYALFDTVQCGTPGADRSLHSWYYDLLPEKEISYPSVLDTECVPCRKTKGSQAARFRQSAMFRNL